jgi:hypothetical protein
MPIKTATQATSLLSAVHANDNLTEGNKYVGRWSFEGIVISERHDPILHSDNTQQANKYQCATATHSLGLSPDF